jgi:hypothetical protein
MNKNLYACVSLMALLLLGVLPAAGQAPAAGTAQPKSAFAGKIDLGLNFTATIDKVATLPTSSRFVLAGGSVDGLYKFTPQWGLVAEVGGSTASNFLPGMNLNELTFAAGPRYTCATKGKFSLYAQSLFGLVHGFNGTFPDPSGAKTSANGLLVEVGGGVTYAINKHYALRLAQADYVLTKLPNASGDTQHSPRFSAGVVAHF